MPREFFDFDRDDPDSLFDFVKALFNVCLWVFVILISIAMLYEILHDGVPPEPRKWLMIKESLGITW